MTTSAMCSAKSRIAKAAPGTTWVSAPNSTSNTAGDNLPGMGLRAFLTGPPLIGFLAEALGLHTNTVRPHLDRMREEAAETQRRCEAVAGAAGVRRNSLP